MKAIKEGRQPTAGPPGGDLSESPVISPEGAPAKPLETSNLSSAPASIKGIPVYQPTAPSAPINFNNLDAADDDVEDEGGYTEEERKAIAAAGKHAKFAMSALLYDDVRTAVINLEQALSKLRLLPCYDEEGTLLEVLQ
jgi:Vta1 C-terminal domain